MLNKRVVLITFLLLQFVSIVARADESHSVNIDLNTSGGDYVQTHAHDQRFSKIREEYNKAQLKQAMNSDKSYVSTAPDADNPDYWKAKNVDSPSAPAQSSKEGGAISPKLFQLQKSALEKVLGVINSPRSVDDKGAEVVYKTKADKTRSSKGRGNTKAPHTSLATAGTIWYSTMATGADSYIPGPVMAVIQEGPFAGGKAVGKFEVAPDGEHLILSFSALSYEGKSYAVSAVAMDPNTRINGITGDIDHHVFTRFIIPGAANFLSSVTQALMSQEQSVVANQSGIIVTKPMLNTTQLALMGASGATKTVADATKPNGVLKFPEVKISAGQGFGFMVLKPIN